MDLYGLGDHHTLYRIERLVSELAFGLAQRNLVGFKGIGPREYLEAYASLCHNESLRPQWDSPAHILRLSADTLRAAAESCRAMRPNLAAGLEKMATEKDKPVQPPKRSEP